MNRIKYILRGIFLLIAVILLSYLNKKTGVNLGTIAKFKLETLNKIKADSLNSKAKVALLVSETTKFNKQINKDSSHARETINYIMGIVLLFIVSEIIFLVIKKNSFVDKNQS